MLFQRDTKGNLKISRRRKVQLVVSYQVVTDPCYGLSVIFCGFISHLTGRETIFSGVHGFTGEDRNGMTLKTSHQPRKPRGPGGTPIYGGRGCSSYLRGV